MRRIFAAGMFIAASLVVGSTAFAQRDGADRSQRLDSEMFRNDIDQQRLRQPAAPLPEQPATPPYSSNKPVHTKKKK